MNVRFSYIGVKVRQKYTSFCLHIRPTGTSGTITGDTKFFTFKLIIKNGEIIEESSLGRLGNYTLEYQNKGIAEYRKLGFVKANQEVLEEYHPGLAGHLLDDYREKMVFQILKGD